LIAPEIQASLPGPIAPREPAGASRTDPAPARPQHARPSTDRSKLWLPIAAAGRRRSRNGRLRICAAVLSRGRTPDAVRLMQGARSGSGGLAAMLTRASGARSRQSTRSRIPALISARALRDLAPDAGDIAHASQLAVRLEGLPLALH
jgi:hypothetical protein